jgi:HSP20 family protein
MALIPWRPRETWWDPFRDLEAIQNEMNKMFNSSLVRWGDREVGLLEGAWSPAIDIYDSKDNVMVKADIPGMKKDEIEVSVHGDTLIIKGEKKQEKEVKEKDYVRTERFYGSFNRAMRLPAAVDASKVTLPTKTGYWSWCYPRRIKAETA